MVDTLEERIEQILADNEVLKEKQEEILEKLNALTVLVSTNKRPIGPIQNKKVVVKEPVKKTYKNVTQSALTKEIKNDPAIVKAITDMDFDTYLTKCKSKEGDIFKTDKISDMLDKMVKDGKSDQDIVAKIIRAEYFVKTTTTFPKEQIEDFKIRFYNFVEAIVED